MAFAERKPLLEAIQNRRGSKVVTYFTGDRPGGGPALNLPLGIETGVVPVIGDALRDVGKADAIDLLLYTRGGQIDVVWPIVSMFREHAKKFSVLVPFRAHSAGTLLVMGADSIVMSEQAELTSIDPTTGNSFNPVDELQPGSRKGISVEDVAAYFALARESEKVKLTDQAHLLEVFKQLTQQVNPLALGHVQRVYMQIRLLAEKLLGCSPGAYSDQRIKKIVATLTEKLYSHTHAVNRQDAKEVFGKTVSLPAQAEEDEIWAAFTAYSDTLKLREPQNILSDLGAAQQSSLTYERGFVETANKSWVFQSQYQITAASKVWQEAFYSQAAQGQVQAVAAGTPGLPIYVPGLPAIFNVDTLFEGWRSNAGGV